MDDLVVNEDITIPASELVWRFSPTGGPGGQHANRSSTKAELTFDVASSRAIDDETRQRIIEGAGSSTLSVSADDTRSQWRNRQIAQRRLADHLRRALRVDAPRVATKPGRAIRQRRADTKRRRSETKRLRKRPSSQDE